MVCGTQQRIKIALTGVILCGFCWAAAPAIADMRTSDATFNEAVTAVKNKDYAHAVRLFQLQAEASQHDAQHNLAILIKSGKGTPQDFQQALIWSWSAQLGGIEAAHEVSEELVEMLPDESVDQARDAVASRLQQRIADGDRQAVSQFASYHITLLPEEDYAQAYIWFSIAAALGLEGSIEARDTAMDEIEVEDLVALQKQAGTIFESLTFD